MNHIFSLLVSFSIGVFATVLLYRNKVNYFLLQKPFLEPKVQAAQEEIRMLKEELAQEKMNNKAQERVENSTIETQTEEEFDYKKEFNKATEQLAQLKEVKDTHAKLATSPNTPGKLDETVKLLNSKCHALALVNSYLVKVIEHLQQDLNLITSEYKQEFELLDRHQFVREVFFNYHQNSAVVANLFAKSISLLGFNQTHTIKNLETFSLEINGIVISNNEFMQRINEIQRKIQGKRRT